MLKRHILYFLLLLIGTTIQAQSQDVAKLTIIVIDKTGTPIQHITVELGNGQKTLRTVTDEQGEAQFESVIPGDYTVTAQMLGHERTTTPIHLERGDQKEVTITILQNSKQLNEVTVQGKTDKQLVSENAVRAVVVDTRAASKESTTLSELLNRSVGIRIRQTGGLGANPDISINGFQGRSIRFFKDGIPVDYLRDGYNLSNIPLNSLDRVEIYKGVLPASLGSDALGGAINFVSAQSKRTNLEASYELGSFNTHRATLNGVYSPNNGKWYAGLESFYNYSDNDYWASVEVPDPVTRNPYPDRVRLFHNGYKSYYAEGFFGFSNRSWADDLKISLAAFEVNREVQHPALMTDPYGAISSRQSSIVPTLRYKKAFLDGRLRLDQFLVYNTVTLGRTDTLQGRYDWYGNYTATAGNVGESRQPSLSRIDFDNFTARTNIRYKLGQKHRLYFNYVLTDVEREGNDPYGPVLVSTGQDVIQYPASYLKQVFGLAHESEWLDGKLGNTLMAKHYRYSSRGIDAWTASNVDVDNEKRQTGNYWGVAEAIKYQLNASSFIRLSAELANRLPEQDELFGNGEWIVPNFELRPEESFNLNLGYRLERQSGFALEANTFYRNTKGLILLVPVQAPYAQYGNQDNARGYGFDLELSYPFWRHFAFNANATWQDLRLFGITNSQDAWKNDARLRNTPYAFANAGFSASFGNLLQVGDAFKAYAFYNYVREFYLETIPKRVEPGGFLGLSGSAQINSSLIIPTQHNVNLGINYSPASLPLSASFEVKNLGDANLYDNFRVQRASRSFHLKITYSINQI